MNLQLSESVRPYTAADFYALPDDGGRWELIRGQLLAMPPPDIAHQRFSMRLAARLDRFLDPLGLVPLHHPVSVQVATDIVLQPDLAVFSGLEIDPRGKLVTRGLPLLVVEILSPSTVRRDLWVKRGLYAEAGIPEMWVADPRNQTITVFRAPDLNGPPVDVLEADGELTSPQFASLRLPCAELWR